MILKMFSDAHHLHIAPHKNMDTADDLMGCNRLLLVQNIMSSVLYFICDYVPLGN
jgi:hypothetical protein